MGRVKVEGAINDNKPVDTVDLPPLYAVVPTGELLNTKPPI